MTAAISENRRSQTAAADMVIRDAVEVDVPAIVMIYNAAVTTRIATAQLEPVSIEQGGTAGVSAVGALATNRST